MSAPCNLDFSGAIEVSKNCLVRSKVTDLLHKCAEQLQIGAFQEARKTAKEALKIDETHPSQVKTRYLLASALYHLRSYAAALEVLCLVQEDSTIQPLFTRLNVRFKENRYGEYNFKAIADEVLHKLRLDQADYCSPLIEVQESKFGGEFRRGVFTKRDIIQGTLIVGSKASACTFFDELDCPTYEKHSELAETSIADSIYRMLTEGHYGLGLLELASGRNSGKSAIELSKDDVHEQWEEIKGLSASDIMKIVRENAFKVSKRVNSLEVVHGQGLFRIPSYFNHCCMSNTDRRQYGDIMFFRTSVMIPMNVEIFITYINIADAPSIEDRRRILHRRQIPIDCKCTLCGFERRKHAIVDSAFELGQLVLEKNTNCRGNPEAIEGIRWACQSIYERFDRRMPKQQFTIPHVRSATP